MCYCNNIPGFTVNLNDIPGFRQPFPSWHLGLQSEDTLKKKMHTLDVLTVKKDQMQSHKKSEKRFKKMKKKNE